jgi:hypothetical protein
MKPYKKSLRYMLLLVGLLFIYSCTKKDNPPSSPASPPPPFSATFDGYGWISQSVTGSHDTGKYCIISSNTNEYESEWSICIVLSNDTVGTYSVSSKTAGCGGSYYAAGPETYPTPVAVIEPDSLGYVKITQSSSNVISGTFNFITAKVDSHIDTYNGSFNNISCK